MAKDKALHGNRYDTGPTVALTVGDLRGGWNGGTFAGDAELVEWAKRAARSQAQVVVFGRTVTCGDQEPLAALAAMASYAPGRVIVSEAPEEVLEALSRESEMAQSITDWEEFLARQRDEDARLRDEDTERV